MKQIKTLTVNGNTYEIADPDAAHIDDQAVGENAWSSQTIIDRLCPGFTERGAAVTCRPVEGYPLEVVSHIDTEGTTEIKLTRCGKNLFDVTAYPFTAGSYISVKHGNRTTSSDHSYTAAYIPVSHLRGLTITLNHIPDGTNPGMAFYDESKAYISGGKGTAMVVPSTAAYMRFSIRNTITDGTDVQWELGSTATGYEPYRGQTFTARLDQTVCGGSYNWQTGELTVTHGADGTELETPATVQLTPTKILALSGQNTLYGNIGDTTVTGKADPTAVMEQLTDAIIALGGNV